MGVDKRGEHGDITCDRYLIGRKITNHGADLLSCHVGVVAWQEPPIHDEIGVGRQGVRRKGLEAHLVYDSVPTAEQRMVVRPGQPLQPLDHLVCALDRAQSLVGNAGMRRFAVDMDRYVNAPPVTERTGESRVELYDTEERLLWKCSEDHLRAGVTATALVVDGPV